jgi:16S rRNA (uracil1498-N3)-methyltransferase
VSVEIAEIGRADDGRVPKLMIVSAIPKGPRADWMIEKLSELGTDAFVPLVTERSVVVPKGESRINRWNRLAKEAARQSRRVGVMRIEQTVSFESRLKTGSPEGWVRLYLLPRTDVPSLRDAIGKPLELWIGPEGGWTDAELAAFRRADVGPARLTASILRTETAAVAAAAVALSH